MPLKSKRVYRIAELIQTVIAQLLKREVNDPRLSKVSITGVDLAPDYGRATVFFTSTDVSAESIKSAQDAFNKAEGFFRIQLSKLTELRYTPKISFKFDASIMQAEHISALLKD